MKMRKKISWLLSFFMVFSLFMGSAGMIVKADGQKAVVRIARRVSTATGTVYYKWDTAAEWTEVNQTAYNDTPIEINRPDDSLDHTVHFKVVCGTGTIINHCQVNKNGAQDASLDKNILTSESGQAFSVSTSEQVELISYCSIRRQWFHNGSGIWRNNCSYSNCSGRSNWRLTDRWHEDWFRNGNEYIRQLCWR